MLHLIQKSPFQSSCLDQCLNIADKHDKFLLMLDGVYAIQQQDFINSDLCIYALEEDLLARGLNPLNNTKQKINIINYAQFVELTVECDKTMSWF